MEVLFTRFHEQLASRGYIARAGQMIDARFVEVPCQRNTREEHAQIQAGETPADWQQPSQKSKLLQKDVDARWTKKNNADFAYRSQEKETRLAKDNIPSQICEKGACNHPLSEEQKRSNTEKSRVRVRVEHVFGAQARMGGHIVRTIGLLRAQVKIGMMNLVYNMMRLGHTATLLRRDRRGAPVVA